MGEALRALVCIVVVGLVFPWREANGEHANDAREQRLVARGRDFAGGGGVAPVAVWCHVCDAHGAPSGFSSATVRLVQDKICFERDCNSIFHFGILIKGRDLGVNWGWERTQPYAT